MRRLAVLVTVTALGLGASPLLPTSALAATAPGAPTGFQQYATAGGVGLTWSPPATDADAPVTGYRVYRGADQISELVAPASGPLTVLDPDLAPSTSADYTVLAFGDGGDGAATPALTVTRPATDPAPGSTDALVMEGINRHYFFDASRAGDSVLYGSAGLSGTRSPGAASATLPVVPGPGTYTTSANPTAAERRLGVNLDGFVCAGFLGSLLVREASFDAQLQPLTYAAELSGTCSNWRITASLRLHSSVPYVAALIEPEPLKLQAIMGETASADVKVTNRGLAPLTVGTPTLSGPQAGDYTIGTSTCTDPVAPDASCTVAVGFTPTANGARTASFDLPLGPPDSTRSLALVGTGGRVPGSIHPVMVDRALRRNQLRWPAPTDPGVPSAVSYRVLKLGSAGYAPIGVTTALTFVDTDVATNGQSRYQVVPFNDAGDGTVAEAEMAVGAAWSVLVASEGPGVDSGLYMVTRVTQQRVPFLADATARFTPTVSPDGSKVVYAQSTVPGNPDAPTDLWVASLTGSTAPARLTSLPGAEYEPTWSPDGATLAFSYETASTLDVRTMSAAGGTPVVRAAGISHPSWLADSTRLVAENYDTGLLYIVDAAGRSTAIAGSADGYAPKVSPDGTVIAYIRDDGMSLPQLAVLPVTGGTALRLNDTAAWDSPTWGANNRSLFGERSFGNGAPQLGQTAYNPGGYAGVGPASVAGVDFTPVFWQEGVHLTSAPKLTGGTATINFGRPVHDAQTTCALDGAEPVTCQQEALPNGSVTYTGLAAGSHRVVIRSTSMIQAADSVTAHEWTVDRAGPVTKVISPAVNGPVLTPSVTFAYRATDTAGVASYDVRYRKATSNGGYGAYTSPAGWSATTAASKVLGVTPGYEYCFSVRGRDRLGNVSAFTPERCVSAALDDRALVASAGWTRPGVAGAYKSTVTTTTRTGTTLTARAVQTRRITLIVTKCASCGQVGVYLGTTRIAVVDTRAATTMRQVKVALPLLSSIRSGALTLKPVTAGRTVQIDGIAFGRA